MTKRQYVETVLSTIDEVCIKCSSHPTHNQPISVQCQKTLPIRAKLLLSINRAMKLYSTSHHQHCEIDSFLISKSSDEANEVVDLAKDYKDRGVVGIDFSGNPLLVRFNITCLH